MSRVTDVFLIVDFYGLVTEEQIATQDFGGNQSLVKFDPEKGQLEWPGGYKHMETDLWCGGFNYVDGKDLEAWFEALPWDIGRAYLVWATNGSRFGSKKVNWIDD